MACLLLRPMKCHHCYHRFTVSWFLTIGKRVRAPTLRIAATNRSDHRPRPILEDASCQRTAAYRESQPRPDNPPRADAA